MVKKCSPSLTNNVVQNLCSNAEALLRLCLGWCTAITDLMRGQGSLMVPCAAGKGSIASAFLILVMQEKFQW